MLRIFYMITTAIAFTSNFLGINTSYYMRLSMGLLWIGIWVVRNKGVLRTHKFLRFVLFPWFGVFFLTLCLWIVNRPNFFNISYFTRMVSNVLYCVVAILNAYIGLELFGKDAIDMSFYSLIGSIAVNTISVWRKYGTALTALYFKTVLFQDYKSGTAILDLAMSMEVQGATMALGLFFVYYLFSCRDKKTSTKIWYLLLSMIGLYIGFKRVVVLGVGLVVAILWMLRFKKIDMRKVLSYSCAVFFAISFGYIFVVKTDLITLIAAYFNVDMMGRTNIYRNVSHLYTLSPIYLGTGFGYAAKYMFDTTGFAVHSDILRMYIELGFVPFVFWLFYNIYSIPKKVSEMFGTDAGKICITATVYTFSTYLVENTMGLYPLHYGLALFTLLYVVVASEDTGCLHR